MSKLILFTLMTLPCFIVGQNSISIEPVTNDIVIGDLAGNRDLAFGVQNILEEVVQDKDYDLNPNAELKLKVSLLFFDIKKTNLQIAVYSKNTDIYQISARATLYKGKKKKKSVTATGEASEVSTATLLIDEGGQFSQANVSTALKKVVEQLINKLKL
tara:strand:- start:176 stop:649 length:474 start_codon:yes stop_codon:yes gene_type:complete